MGTRLIKVSSLLIGVAFVAAACGAAPGNGSPTTVPPPSYSPPSFSLDGTSWVVTGGTHDGQSFSPVGGRTATLSVQAGRATGSTGCNTYSASISSRPDGGLSFTAFAVTEIGCEPEVMNFETAMLTVLSAVDRFTLDADSLTLSNADGSVALRLVAAVPEPDTALDATTWRLTGITSGDVASSVVSGTRPFLIVDLTAGALRGNGGCNDFGAQVNFDGNRMWVSDMVYTEIACDEGVMRVEADYFRILAGAATWQVTGTTLVVATGAGEALTFSADPTARPEDAAKAWIAAVSTAGLDTAAALMAPASPANAERPGGPAVFAADTSSALNHALGRAHQSAIPVSNRIPTRMGW